MRFRSSPHPSALSGALVDWYRGVARDLPWRRDADDPVHGPYRVWVSEIMLQQTQVATVVPYYRRWVDRLPSVEALAAAPLDVVLGLWAGLGYYARARNLHRAATVVMARHGGAVPRAPGALEALPGVGPYTAGAIRSIAFHEPAPLVDGNVARVLARLDLLEGDPGAPPLRRALWARAEALVTASEDPSAHNQGLMELGATVCTPLAPACPLCPWEADCRARAAGRTAEVPPVARRTPRRQESGWCGILLGPAGVRLARRLPQGLLGGLWEPPRLSDPPPGARSLGTVRHVFTHLELTLHVLSLPPGVEPAWLPATYDTFEWVPPEDLPGRGLSALARKALALAELPGAAGPR